MDILPQSNIIRVKIIRHSNRLDYSNPLKWMFYFGHDWCDSPLTSNGYVNAKKKGQTLAIGQSYNPKNIYTSPYNRTMATATEIKSSFPQTEIIVEPLLAEFQPNPYAAHTIGLYPNGIPTTYDGTPTDFAYPESRDSFNKRVQFIISNLVKKNSSDLMIITHGEVLKSYISHLQNLFPNLLLDPGSTPYLTCLSFDVDKTDGTFVNGSIYLE